MPRALLERHFPGEEAVSSGIWLRMRMDLLDPGQRSGWKLHLSATPASYAALLEAAFPVLRAAHVPFKLLAATDDVERMAAGEYGLMQTGKCITVYPRTEEDAAALGAQLAIVLHGIPGPAIPGDIPFSLGAPVYFRFGPYDGRVEIDAMGQERRLLWRPDLGRDVWDSTSGGPEEMPPRACLPAQPAPDHLAFLREDFEIANLLHLTAKGGVFQARARLGSGAPLLIKTARPHTNSDMLGRDAIYALRREHALLVSLRGVPGIPEAGSIIASDQAAAIVRPYIAGRTFWELWTAPGARLLENRRLLQSALDEVLATVRVLHTRGIVVRDLAPGNILIAPDRAYLMDLELAHALDDPTPPYRRGTRGFFDPDRPVGAPAGVEEDEYALAALSRMVSENGTPILRRNPGNTPPVVDIETALRNEIARCNGEPRSQSAWNVYEGHAGIVCAAHELGIAPESLGVTKKLADALLNAATQVLHIPGYHFGAAGYAVAAGLLGRFDDADAILQQAAARESDVPDICQGHAGRLLACVQLFEHVGNECFRTHAARARERLLSLAKEEDGALLWRWPKGPFGDLSGAACLGFGHGLAGILYALLRAEAIAPSASAREHIERGLVSLLRLSRVVPGTRDALWWPVSREDDTCWNAWCHGTPGVVKALATAARAGLADAPLLHAALRGMALANNSELCLCHGTASRLDAMSDCMAIPGFKLPEEALRAARSDFDTLAAIAEPAQFEPSGSDMAQGLMTGLPGVLLALHRARAWR